MNQQTLLLIDGFNLLSRSYFATAYGRTEEQLRNSKGQYTNALRPFFQKLFKLISDYRVTHVTVAWDVKREESTRRLKYDFYKATRSELPDPLIQQYELCTDILEKIGVPQMSIPNYEADDVIGSLATKWCADIDERCFIYSNDRDLLQLLSTNISQIIASKKGEFVYTLEDFEAEYGITSSQWIDVKALLGDSSDNIPGCPGVGEKSALPLVQQYNSVEELFEKIDELDKKYNRYKNKLIEGRESVFISKELATIDCQISEFDMIDFQKLKLSIKQDNVLKVMTDLELRIKYYTV